jgi:hypothetical protein
VGALWRILIVLRHLLAKVTFSMELLLAFNQQKHALGQKLEIQAGCFKSTLMQYTYINTSYNAGQIHKYLQPTGICFLSLNYVQTNM